MANVLFEGGVYHEPEPHNLASVLSKAGYTTGMVGKWHQGIDAGRFERRYAYQEVASMRGVVAADGFHYVATRFPPEIREQIDDIDADPEERYNLADDERFADVLARFRNELDERVQDLPHAFCEFGFD